MMRRTWFLRDKIFPSILITLTFLVGGMVPAATALDYEGEITAKMSDIRAKQADLAAAQRQLDIINEFLDDYAIKTGDLLAARQQLLDADDRLATINRNNLVKSTIKMAITTGKTVSDAITFGKTVTSAFVTTGLKSAVGKGALEMLQSALDDNRKKRLGLDDETLCGVRNVKIKAVSDAARAATPSLGGVQQTLALDGYAVASACLKDTGEVLDPTGPGVIFYKNGMVRAKITEALNTLDTLGTEAETAKTDADTNQPIVLAEVNDLKAQLAALNAAFEELKTRQRQEEDAARLATNQTAVAPPVHQPIPAQGDTESASEYQDRKRTEALTRWNSEAPPLIGSIDSCKTQIESAQATIDAAVSASITVPMVAEFISVYGGGDALDANTTASYKDAISSCAAIEQRINDVTPVGPALPGIIAQVEALTDLYNELFNLQNQIVSLKTLLEESGVTSPPPNYYSSNWSSIPGMGQAPAEDLAVLLAQQSNLLTLALANAHSLGDKLAAATDAWSAGIGSVRDDLDGSLAAAEAALAALIAQGAAWENALAASPGLVLDPLAPILNQYPWSLDPGWPAIGRLGYFSENPDDYTLVLGHAFDMATYKASLLTALATPGSTGLAATRGVLAKYDALVAANPAMKNAYDAAWQSYRGAFPRVQAYAGQGSLRNLPVYDDWFQAAAFTSEAHPVDASAVTNQTARYRALLNTNNAVRWTNLTGGPLVGGESINEQLSWSGLPFMHQLPDPGLDDPANYLPHRIAAMKAVITEDSPTWIPLAEDAFNTHFNDAMDRLNNLDGDAFQADDGSQAVVTLLRDELAPLQSAYYAAHPAPTITVQPVGSVIQAGATAQLFVSATSDLLTYQWSMSADPNGMYTEIEGATSDTLTTPALSATRWFRVVIRNPGGVVNSDSARVEISGGSSDFVFTSAASASAQVGVLFSWTFVTSVAGMIGVNPITPLPAGLTFANGKLEGTPTAEGTWYIQVMASRPGPPGPQNQPIQQTFHLTIAPPDSNAVTLADAILALQVVSGITPATSLSKLTDVNGDGKIGLAEVIDIMQKTAGMRQE